MRKKLFILASLVCIVAISSPVYAASYFGDQTAFLTDLGSLTLTVENFESDPWPPVGSNTQPTVSMGVSWTSTEDLFTTNVVALSGLLSISPLDVGGGPVIPDELNAVLPANVFAVGGFVDNFGSFAPRIQMAAFDAADNMISLLSYSAIDIDWYFLGIITDTPIARVRFSGIADAAQPDIDDFALDDLYFGVAAVPEPATMLLLGSGLIGLLAFRRKFSK